MNPRQEIITTVKLPVHQLVASISDQVTQAEGIRYPHSPGDQWDLVIPTAGD